MPGDSDVGGARPYFPNHTVGEAGNARTWGILGVH